jgi:hypothetical protein
VEHAYGQWIAEGKIIVPNTVIAGGLESGVTALTTCSQANTMAMSSSDSLIGVDGRCRGRAPEPGK